jgi:hypothetical protein
MSTRIVFRAALGCATLAVLGCSGESPTGLNQSPETPAAKSMQSRFTPAIRAPGGKARRMRGRDEDGPDDDDSGSGDANGGHRRSGYLVVAGRR